MRQRPLKHEKTTLSLFKKWAIKFENVLLDAKHEY